MAEVFWPPQGSASLLGGEHNRIDGLAKCIGSAKYAYDVVPDNMLVASALSCPHAHATIRAIDLNAARNMAGVVAVEPLKKEGDEIRWEGDLVAVVAGETEAAVAEGLAAIKIEYEVLDHFVDDTDLDAATEANVTRPAGRNTQLQNRDEDADQEFERLFNEAAVTFEGHYGINVITHMCLETHGSTCESQGDKLVSHLSTQNVSGTPGQIAGPIGLTAQDVTVHCDYIGGGFGSKFAADAWGVTCAQLARNTGRPVKYMLTRSQELKNAGNRPSGFLRAKIAADKDGFVTAWDSAHWGTNGTSGAPVSQGVIPYVFNPPNRRRVATGIRTNTSPARAWRAPNHPQGCAITQTAYDDVARHLGLDSYDVFLRNLSTVGERAPIYEDQMKLAAKLMDWKAKWHPHGKGGQDGSVVSGLGMAIHTWGGGPHASRATCKIHPDGGVEIFLGSQDLGTGTRTVIGLVVAETLGLELEQVSVQIGLSEYPSSGPSGGSTTVGGVSESTRRAATAALNLLLTKVAPRLEADANQLEAVGGKIQIQGNQNRNISWKEACGQIGISPIEAQGEYAPRVTYPRNYDGKRLTDNGVAGVQMAEVAVDTETGVVKMKKFVAVQDIGLIINRKTARSQIYGAAIMGIAYALFEERIMDKATGAFVNAELADYKLPRLGDTGEIVVELYEPESEYNRGVIGLGEPPVISPGAAISNAVCNALGKRVSVLPITPQRVLEAISGGA
ncbi:MAG: xanthine dehydrogenase family protein molybdopterin-binding subunit [Pirellulales bacterium]|nr:xanthine dehydrogenase family protein molybdopterin-binding subunit [Pirellulales bacterium]